VVFFQQNLSDDFKTKKALAKTRKCLIFSVDQPGLEPGMTIASQDTPTAKGKCPID